MIIAIDFDKTIHDIDHPVEGMRMGPPMQGAVEAFKTLKSKGHTLVVFTNRGGSPKHVEEWMNYYKIPFDKVTNIKENFDLILDDRAYRHTNWTDTMAYINNMPA